MPTIRLLNESQWRQRYRAMLQHYRRKSYLAHNRFFVMPYIDPKGRRQ